MKNMLLAWALCVLSACGGAGEADPTSSREFEAEVAGFLDAFQSALEVRDLDALRGFYALEDHFEWVEDGSVRYRSPDEIVEALSGLPQDASFRTEYSARTIRPVGIGGALVSTQFRTVMGTSPDAFEFGGMITMVLENGAAGWQIIGGHTSTAQEGRR
jgi:hypothetical protein